MIEKKLPPNNENNIRVVLFPEGQKNTPSNERIRE